MNAHASRYFVLASVTLCLCFLFACAPSGTDPEPDLTPQAREIVRFDQPRYFGEVPIVSVDAVGRALHFTTADGQSYELSIDETNGVEIRSPRFSVSWRQEGEELFIHEQALLDNGELDELSITRQVDDEGIAIESYGFNGDARSFRVEPGSSARNEFASWYHERIGPSGLNEENNPHAASFGSFIRSRELRLFLIGMVAASTSDPGTRDEAERLFAQLKSAGEDGSDDAVDWLASRL